MTNAQERAGDSPLRYADFSYHSERNGDARREYRPCESERKEAASEKEPRRKGERSDPRMRKHGENMAVISGR